MESQLERTAPPADMPIPDRLNAMITIFVFCAGVALLLLGSWLEWWPAVLAVGVLFSYLLLTNYALLHESAHHNLHSRPVLNRLLGTLAGMLFPCPYSMIEAMHQGHHLRNRTDYEMFDLYYATESRVVRFVQWYGILCGFFWPVVPLGAVLFAGCPAILRTRLITGARSASYLVGDIRQDRIRAIRWEVLATVLLFGLLFWLGGLKWQNTLFLYGCFAFNWSTRQYIGHAFTKRDVIEGAYNLRHNRVMSWVLMNSQWDLNHHRHPEVSWYYLPRLARETDDPQPSYIRQYWRLWRGPRLNTEPAPESLRELPLSIHS